MIVSAVTVFLHSSADCFLIIAVIYAVLKEYNAGMPETVSLIVIDPCRSHWNGDTIT